MSLSHLSGNELFAIGILCGVIAWMGLMARRAWVYAARAEPTLKRSARNWRTMSLQFVLIAMVTTLALCAVTVRALLD